MQQYKPSLLWFLAPVIPSMKKEYKRRVIQGALRHKWVSLPPAVVMESRSRSRLVDSYFDNPNPKFQFPQTTDSSRSQG